MDRVDPTPIDPTRANCQTQRCTLVGESTPAQLILGTSFYLACAVGLTA